MSRCAASFTSAAWILWGSDFALEKKLFTQEDLDRILTAEQMTKPGVAIGRKQG